MCPEVYSDAWTRLLKAAGCTSPVTLYGARHGSATRMLAAGQPVHVVAAWHGHDPAVLLRNYAHADRDALADAGATLYAGEVPCDVSWLVSDPTSGVPCEHESGPAPWSLYPQYGSVSLPSGAARCSASSDRTGVAFRAELT